MGLEFLVLCGLCFWGREGVKRGGVPHGCFVFDYYYTRNRVMVSTSIPFQ